MTRRRDKQSYAGYDEGVDWRLDDAKPSYRKQSAPPSKKPPLPPHLSPPRDQGHCHCRHGNSGHKARANAHGIRPRWNYLWYRGPIDVKPRKRGHERSCPAWRPPLVEPLPKPKKRREKRGQSKPGRR